MITFLLLVSFLLHVFTFIIIKTLKDKLMNNQDVEMKQKRNIKEIEDLLAVYLLEFREENDKVIEALKHQTSSEKTVNKENNKDKGLNYKKKVKNDDNELKTDNKIEPSSTPFEPGDYIPPLENDSFDTLEQSLTSKVLSLHEQGETLESIARKLDCGKTEVELMLKFHRKNS